MTKRILLLMTSLLTTCGAIAESDWQASWIGVAEKDAINQWSCFTLLERAGVDYDARWLDWWGGVPTRRSCCHPSGMGWLCVTIPVVEPEGRHHRCERAEEGHPGGMQAISRWLSEERVTPPVWNERRIRIPEGCQHGLGRVGDPILGRNNNAYWKDSLT